MHYTSWASTAFPIEGANSEVHIWAPRNHRGTRFLLQPHLHLNLLTQGSQQKTGWVQVNITLLPMQLYPRLTVEASMTSFASRRTHVIWGWKGIHWIRRKTKSQEGHAMSWVWSSKPCHCWSVVRMRLYPTFKWRCFPDFCETEKNVYWNPNIGNILRKEERRWNMK